ncbi:MAG: S1 RNA-binding domain-containing protein [Candidatus Micrarchaeia archaeon]|jgi:translation initiation factor 2 subunit 1
MPEEGELVLVKIKKILPYGAFCDLEEYKKEGFVHISEVASRWIKNIHEFVSEGKSDVAKVIKVDKEKGQIDLSLKQVTESDKKRKIDFVRKDKRVNKLIEQAGKQSKLKDKEIEDIKNKLIDEFGELSDALEEISAEGKEALKNLKLPKKFEEELIILSKKAIKKQKAIIRGILNMCVYEPEGVDIIKKTLSGIKSSKNILIDILYVGAPRYEITIEADDYKTAEKTLEKIIKTIKEKTADKVVEISFEKKEREK